MPKNNLENSDEWIVIPKRRLPIKLLQQTSHYDERPIGPTRLPENLQEDFATRQARFRKYMARTIRDSQKAEERAKSYDGPPIRYSLAA